MIHNMSRTTTVEIASGQTGMQFRLFKSDVDHPNALVFEHLMLPSGLPPLRTRPDVMTYGELLRTALYKHPAVQAELEQMFGIRPQDQGNLQFVMATNAAEPYRWEALSSEPTDCFLALKGPCSLKRIAWESAGTMAGLRSFSGPIRMLAFLSPSKITSVVEFEAIKAAVADARAHGLAIEATIYLGEQKLLDQAERDAATGVLSGIRVAPIPGNALAMEQAILEHPVQILHFFCHGHIQDSVQLLEFASISDHDLDALNEHDNVQGHMVAASNGHDVTGERAARSPIYLSAVRLTQILSSLDTVWLTVLNSCSGAQETPGLFSMAGELTKTSSPVTIGMAEPIRSDDASVFAEAFYRQAFQIIGNAINDLPVGRTSMIDLGPAVSHARARLHLATQNAPEDTFGRWCLPILYERYTPLRVGHAPDEEMRKRIAVVAHSLRNLASNAPYDLRDLILTALDRSPSVPSALRPDRFGNFP
jgi:hypothetical protein